jgi:hypothetical protein
MRSRLLTTNTPFTHSNVLKTHLEHPTVGPHDVQNKEHQGAKGEHIYLLRNLNAGKRCASAGIL